MFTGIIERLGRIVLTTQEGSNLRLVVETDILNELKIDQSIAHNGVCLTVEKINSQSYEVVAVKETIEKTNLSGLKLGSLVNLERCMQMNDRLDGHIVQGHVDGLASISNIKLEEGSWVFDFKLANPTSLIVEKGSVCINGVSLTAFNVSDNGFSVTIIPFTYDHTCFHKLSVADNVNIEFDIVGKYIQRMLPDHLQ